MEISAIAVGKSGKILATGQIGTIFQKLPDAPIILWNYESKEPIAVLKGMQVSVKKLAFSPDDRFLAALGENNTFIIWDTRDGSSVHKRVTEFSLTALAWGDTVDLTSNPKHPSYSLITACQNSVFINKLEFEIASMQYILKQGQCQLPNTGLIRNYTFAQIQGDMLFCGTTGGEICLFSVASSIYRATMPISSNGVLSMALFADHIFVGSGDGKLKKIFIGDGRWNLTHEAQFDSKIMALSVSIDGKELMAGTVGGKLYRVLESDLSFLLHTDSHTGFINDLHFNPLKSDQFVSIDANGCCKIWDLTEYKSVFTGTTNRVNSGTSCCLALDDDTVVTGWRDGFIRCFAKETNAVVWEIANAHRGAVTSLHVDANYILSGGEEGAVRVWARVNRKLLIQFNDQKKDIVSLFPDLNKPFLVHSCSMDRTLSTYDLKVEKRMNGHQTKNGSLYGMTQRKDNEFELVTCGQGAPIFFWDCDEIDPVARIDYPYKVLSIQVSPSGRFLAFGTETNEVFVYSLHGQNQV
mmetsp:Transcript_16095/g.27186  ORF Transcript_16095/g.27186 Transcript_16095/m.27186 type:complete len:524 (+) Transcript_16095:277-1848(+)